jgi:hypothetical protein
VADKKTYGSGSGESRYYIVEARTTFTEPQEVNGVLLTNQWKRLPVGAVPRVCVGIGAGAITVPASSFAAVDATRMGLMERAAAYALAVRFMVDSGDGHHGMRAGRSHLCVETRLVEVKLTHSYSVEEVGVCEPFSLFESLRDLKSTPRESSQTSDAVDPQADSTGKPTTRV